MARLDRLRPLAAGPARAFGRARTAVQPGWQHVAPVLGVVTPLGWNVLAAAVVSWIIGWRLGWTEMMVLATGALALLVVAALMTIGRARISVRVTADPQRVTVGEPAAGEVSVRNEARTPLLPIGLELPIGTQAARFQLPFLGAGSEHDELFVVPTQRRGVVAVGPAMTVRGDPFGLMRRTVNWTDALEIFVHPVTVPLEPMGAGLLRDLEGTTTNDLSTSDLAFHALRDYQPGDDRRYIHWRSSAKAGRFLVRQFLDTRRSHICLVVDSDERSYTDPDDYETAISAAASIAVRVVQDEQEITAFAGTHIADSNAGRRILDTFSRAELTGNGLVDLTRRALGIAPDASNALLITGAHTDFGTMRHAAAQLPMEVQCMVLRIDPTQRTSISGDAGMPILTLQALNDLAPLLAGVLS